MSAQPSPSVARPWFAKHPFVHVVASGQECLAFDGAAGTCHILNETAGWLLTIADRPVEVAEAVRLARETYQVPDGADLDGEVGRGLDELRDRGLLELHRDDDAGRG